jgi:hypothetical protein
MGLKEVDCCSYTSALRTIGIGDMDSRNKIGVKTISTWELCTGEAMLRVSGGQTDLRSASHAIQSNHIVRTPEPVLKTT